MRDRALLAISQGIVIVDALATDEPIIFASESSSPSPGTASTRCWGGNCRFTQGPESDHTVLREIGEAIRAGKDCSVEILNYRKDGSAFWNSLTISPVRDERGTVTHFVGVQTDITDRKEIYAQLLQAQKMNALGTLAGRRRARLQQHATGDPRLQRHPRQARRRGRPCARWPIGSTLPYSAPPTSLDAFSPFRVVVSSPPRL